MHGCSTSDQNALQTVTGLAMGTNYTVKWLPQAEVDSSQFPIQIRALVTGVESVMSTYMDASDLSGLNAAPINVWHPVPKSMAELIAEAQQISQDTHGAFDITVGSAVNLWGFGPQSRFENVPTEQQLQALRPLVGYEKISVRQAPAAVHKDVASSIDLSAMAKGYGVDQIALWLQQQGIENHLVEIGGELRTKGRKSDQQPWRIAIESPAKRARSVFAVVRVENIALATSGNYRNYYEEQGVRYSHTLDPRTLRPVQHKLASVTVMAATAARADALATALMVMGEEQGMEWATVHQVPSYFIIRQGSEFIAQAIAGFDDMVQDNQ